MLTFDESTHSYYWNGVKVPGVTSIISEWVQITVGVSGARYHVNRFNGQVIPSEVMEEASAKGKDIHFGCNLSIQDGIDWDALDQSYIGPLQQFQAWMDRYKPLFLYTEAPFYSQRRNYAGTIDIIAHLQGRKELVFIDIKTGDSKTVGPQLAAYEKGWCEENRYLGKTERYALWLPKNGSPFKFEKLTNPMDWEFFKSCLLQRSFLKGA